ncbi:MAG: DNA-processing protein DprA [Prevotella sp.]|nr:DNA-processing protein DprA [Prevotella sp.]
MNQQEIISAIALTRINYLTLANQHELFRRVGSATEILAHSNDIRSLIPDASDRLVESFTHTSEAIHFAEEEMRQMEALDIEPLVMNDARYPTRLQECPDAPLVLYYKGSANLNQKRVISIVGTRHVTPYGQDLIRRFVSELRQRCPEVLIVSGLAYGVDICAHREALSNGYETVGVLAHGLDTLYPTRHQSTADEMLKHGGLITEYTTHSHIDKQNFVRRNRIVAGMADATILVESAAHGGGLITTRIATDYHRDVFAFPGAVGAPYSEGCNLLIRDNGAALITSANDLVVALGWQSDAELSTAHQKGIERQLFPELTAEEQQVVDVLQRQNDQQINVLSVQSGIPVGRMAAILFSLEMKGVVRTMAGGTYHLLA